MKRRRAKEPPLAGEIAKERSRFARELHAGAGQPLSGILLNLELLRECACDLPPSAQEALNRLEILADEALQQVRALSHRLHPPRWQQLSTVRAIEHLLNASGIAAHYKMDFLTSEFRCEPPHSVKVALYRCVQEGLSNIVRHSGATAVRIELQENRGFVHLRMGDNGHGFETGNTTGGIGLSALEEHAGALAGNCRLRTGPLGTEIVVSIPMEDNE